MRSGPKATISPAKLVACLDGLSDHRTGGHPNRRRHYINGVAVSATDARMIRRWRAGQIHGVTESTTRALLRRYHINPRSLNDHEVQVHRGG